jgi:hypothetical protein
MNCWGEKTDKRQHKNGMMGFICGEAWRGRGGFNQRAQFRNSSLDHTINLYSEYIRISTIKFEYCGKFWLENLQRKTTWMHILFIIRWRIDILKRQKLWGDRTSPSRANDKSNNDGPCLDPDTDRQTSPPVAHSQALTCTPYSWNGHLLKVSRTEHRACSKNTTRRWSEGLGFERPTVRYDVQPSGSLAVIWYRYVTVGSLS